MAADRAGRQIQQLVDFIKLEAKEKATEIRIRTDHDFALEKQKIAIAAKRKLDKEYAHKRKDQEMKRRIESSKSVGSQRTRLYVHRDGLMQKLAEEAKGRLNAVSSGPKYVELLEGLIIQAAGRLDNKTLSVQCREVDQKAATEAAQAASAKLPGRTVSVSTEKFVDARSAGGVKISALEGKIVCDNTLEARLELALHDLQPVVRHMLFPSCRAEDRRGAKKTAEVPDLLA